MNADEHRFWMAARTTLRKGSLVVRRRRQTTKDDGLPHQGGQLHLVGSYDEVQGRLMQLLGTAGIFWPQMNADFWMASRRTLWKGTLVARGRRQTTKDDGLPHQGGWYCICC
jgi:hypothetical protein